MSSLDRNDAFTIIWKIHNFSMIPEIEVCDADHVLYTPSLIIDMLDKTDWYLSLSSEDIHGDQSLLCRLYRDDCSPLSITISYSIELVSINSSKLNNKILRHVFDEHSQVMKFSFGKLDEIYNKKDNLLPNDILTVQCRMWKSGTCNSPTSIAEQKVAVENSKSAGCKDATGQSKKLKLKTLINHVYAQNVDKLDPKLSSQMYISAKECLKVFTKNLLPNKCVVRTQIELERRSILCTIEKLSEIQPGQRIFIPVLPTKQDDSSLILAFYLAEGDDDCELRIDIQRESDGCPIFVKRAIAIFNAECEDQDCIQDTRLLTDPDTWHLTLAKRNKLLGEDHYLKNDTLFLRCEFAISRYTKNFVAEVIVSYPESHRIADVSDSVDWENDLKTELIRIHQKADFCDIVLKVGQRSFCAHKFVLCASSAYFADLFINDDFKEQKLVIEDCEPGVLEKLLKYMYSGVLEKMQLADLMKLYFAATKFRVASLKRLCSVELRASLSVFNACDVLNVADLHKDQFLMVAVGKFISEFANEVFHSSKWKLLMEGNPKLTGIVMHEVLTNKYTL